MNKILSLFAFIQKHQVVTTEELAQFANDRLNITDNNYLYSAYLYPLKKKGYISNPRRGLYAYIDVEEPYSLPNPSVFATKLRHPYYLGYASALELLGAAAILSPRVVVAVGKRHYFSSFSYPPTNPRYQIMATVAHNFSSGLTTVNYNGKNLILSSKARTFIEIVDRPYLVGPWEEIVRSLDALAWQFEEEDIQEITYLLELFDKRALAAKIGFLLEMFKEFGILDPPLDELKNIRAWVVHGSVNYLMPKNDLSKKSFNSRWNLYIPHDYIGKLVEGQRLGRRRIIDR